MVLPGGMNQSPIPVAALTQPTPYNHKYSARGNLSWYSDPKDLILVIGVKACRCHKLI